MSKPYTHRGVLDDKFDTYTATTYPNSFPSSNDWDAISVGSQTGGHRVEINTTGVWLSRLGCSNANDPSSPWGTGNQIIWRSASYLPPSTFEPQKLDNKPPIRKYKVSSSLFDYIAASLPSSNGRRILPLIGFTFPNYNGEEVRLASSIRLDGSNNMYFESVLVYYDGAAWQQVILNSQLMGTVSAPPPNIAFSEWEVEMEIQMKTSPDIWKLQFSHQIRYPATSGTLYTWSGEVSLPAGLLPPQDNLGEAVDLVVGSGNLDTISTLHMAKSTAIGQVCSQMQVTWDDIYYEIEYYDWNSRLILRDTPKGRVIS